MFEPLLWTLLYIIVGSLALVSLFYIWFFHRFKYWNKKNVYTPPTSFPFGNSREMMYDESLHIGEQFEKFYAETKSRPYVGIFVGYKPILVVNDLELAKNILVKDFMHFTDHGFGHNEHYEPLEGHLFNVNGNRWRNLRVRLLPSFTSGKMKVMFDTIVKFSIELQNYLDPYVESRTPVDLKEMLSRFGTDIVGTCVFGVECKSIANEMSKFRMMSRKSQRLSIVRKTIQNLSFMAPWIVSNMKMSMYQTDVNKFFLNAAKEIFEYRKENKVQANDYMQTLIKLREERIAHEQSGKHIHAETEDDDTMSLGDLAAQLFVFFVDGVETSSTTAGFALYELARNPDIQERLVNEIREVIDNHGGRLTYEAFSDMKYLNQVVEEALRMYPPLPLLTRKCTKPYQLPGTDTIIDKSISVAIPMLGIHRDPEFYPNPMQFNPDNFSPEKKAERHRFAHLPFGEGPRMCMGTRFGAIMTRMGLVSVLSKYKISVESKYVKPFTFVPSSFILVPIEGINLSLEKRENPLTIKS